MVDKSSNLSTLTKVARGKRAKLLRATLRLNRPDCVKKFNIPIGSLQTWEEGRYGGLTKKGANRLIEAYTQEGLNCSVEWLLEGTGPAPSFSHKEIFLVAESEKTQPQITNPNTDIQQELLLFHKHNESSIDAIISDDTLVPYLQKGDLVAGVRFFAEDIKKALGTLCIVQTITGEMLIGFLESEIASHSYSLFNCSYANKKLIKPDIKLFSAAPIIWIRRNLLGLINP